VNTCIGIVKEYSPKNRCALSLKV